MQSIKFLTGGKKSFLIDRKCEPPPQGGFSKHLNLFHLTHDTFRGFSKTKTARNYGNRRRSHLSETRWKLPQPTMLLSVPCHFQKIGFHHSLPPPPRPLTARKFISIHRFCNSRFIRWQVANPKLKSGVDFTWDTDGKKILFQSQSLPVIDGLNLFSRLRIDAIIMSHL